MKKFYIILIILIIICFIIIGLLGLKELKKNLETNKTISSVYKIEINSNEKESISNLETIITNSEIINEINNDINNTENQNKEQNLALNSNNLNIISSNKNNFSDTNISTNVSNNTINNDKTNNTSNTSSNSNSDVNESTTANTGPDTIAEETQETKNDRLRKNIQNKYGVTIKYGSELPNYKPKRAEPVRLLDAERISIYLNKINQVLSTYPSGFFRDFNNKGMPLTIFLVEKMEGNAFAGFFDREIYSDLKLTITASTFYFEKTLNHELMHYIDAYLEIVMYPDSQKTEWVKLNPPDFTYGLVNTSYIFFNNPSQGYFIREYSQTNYREDRATVFEDMMTRSYKNAYYNDGSYIKEKAKLISKQIRQYFPSVAGKSPHWDRFLY